jgi:hypothetical protein
MVIAYRSMNWYYLFTLCRETNCGKFIRVLGSGIWDIDMMYYNRFMVDIRVDLEGRRENIQASTKTCGIILLYIIV